MDRTTYEQAMFTALNKEFDKIFTGFCNPTFKPAEENKMKRYIASTPYCYVETDDLTKWPDAQFYVEVKILEKKQEGNLKRCSHGSNTEEDIMREIFRQNEMKPNPYFTGKA